MNKKYEELRAKAYSALRVLARECEEYKEAQLLVGSAETEASLRRRTVRRSIDTEWVEKIEAALPSLDMIIRRPTVAIEDVEEVLPIELTRRVSEKSIKHLARHTNLIREVDGDEVIPSHLLNVFREETLLTYENRFINTLLHRLSAFITLRYRALAGGSGVEQSYAFEYKAEFEHPNGEDGINRARVGLTIELTTPPSEDGISEAEIEMCARYRESFARIEKLHLAILAYLSSPFAQALGRSFVRPPVIRTNAILKNQHFRNCLTLWEYIESCDKAGYSMSSDAYAEMPSSTYVSDLYSAVALEYAQFFHGIVGDGAERKLLASKHLGDMYPDFSADLSEEELEDYRVYDSEYRKTVPVSRLMNNKKKLSEDERRIREAIIIALRADEILTAEQAAAEAEARRLEQERRAAEAERRKREAAALRDPIAIRYKRSFMARLIQSDDTLKNYYSIIKNELLSYERVRAQLSFRGESYRRGRETLAGINILGKTLYLYLDLSLDVYGKKHFVSPSGKEGLPLLVKVRSDRSLAQALRLIGEMMKEKSIIRIEREAVDYRLPYEEDAPLIERGLIKVILPKGVVKDEYDTLVKADIPTMIGGHGGIVAVDEIGEGEEPLNTDEDAEKAEQTEEDEETEQIVAGVPMSDPVAVRYKRSFTARLIKSDDTLKNYYSTIKNELLAYERVRAQMSFRGESYRRGRETLAGLNILGKTLYLYLDLSLDVYGKKHFVSPSGKEGLPLLVKVRSDRSLAQALRLIGAMMKEKSIIRTERETVDYRLPYEEDEPLIERGLIKVILPKGADANSETVKADIASMIGDRSGATVAANTADASAEATNLPEPLAAEAPAADEESTAEDSGDSVELTEEAVQTEEIEETAETEVSAAILPFVDPVAVRYKRSYLSRLIQASDEIKEYHNTIKNELLAYQRIKARTSFRLETFKQGRLMLAQVNLLGRTLLVYLNLSMDVYGRKNYVSPSGKEGLPLLVKVRSDRSLTQALRLIGAMMKEQGIARTDRAAEDYRLPYEDNDALIERGLIKLILPKGAPVGGETVKADISAVIGGREPIPEVSEEVEFSSMAVEAETEEKAEAFADVAVETEASEATEQAPTAEEAEELIETEEAEQTPAVEEPEQTPAVEEAESPEIAEPAEQASEEAESPEIAEPVEQAPEESAEALDAADADVDAEAYAKLHHIGVEREVTPEAVDLSAFEVGDVVFAHEIDSAMIERLGSDLHAVKISETDYVGHTLIKVRLDRIPNAIRKKMRLRERNIVFLDSEATVGYFVPYTRAEYFSLSGKVRKTIFLTAVAVAEYNRAVMRLALLHHIADERFFEMLAHYEMHCRELAEQLPKSPEWGRWIKEL